MYCKAASWLAMKPFASSLLPIFALLQFLGRTASIPLDQFYAYGPEAGDDELVRNDDESSSTLTLPVPFPFFDEEERTLFVNNNGVVSFRRAVTEFTPEAFPLNNLLIAPFWGDVDTRDDTGNDLNGIIYYRSTASSEVLLRAQADIRAGFSQHDNFSPTLVFIATWFRVGYYDQKIDKSNTFQAVMATDGIRSFSIFLYADGEIEWTTGDASNGTDGLGGIPAQVGFDAGDGINYAVVAESRQPEIINITQTSNVGRPGVWIFQVDENVEFAGCCDTDTTRDCSVVSLFPNYGNVLGGQPVTVSGPCFKETDDISCLFDGVETSAVFIEKFEVLCVSPALSQPGRTTFELAINRRIIGETIFISLGIDKSHQVDIIPSSSSATVLLLESDEVKIKWDPSQVFPLLPAEDYKIDISLYAHTSGVWRFQQQVGSNLPNSGEMTTTIALPSLTRDVFRIAVQVSIHIASLGSAANALLLKLRMPSGQWSAEFYYSTQDVMLTRTGHTLCSAWCSGQASGVGLELLNAVTACPTTATRAAMPNSRLTVESFASFFGNTLYDTQRRSYFHPSASVCFRQQEVGLGLSSPGQHCCYDNEGALLVGPSEGGSVDRISPDSDVAGHFTADIRPFILCCKTAVSDCQSYYEKRPSDNGMRFNPPPPAWTFGDPHFVTLDGLKYTFNGKGEYTLLMTDDSSLVIQGRMEQPMDTLIKATMFTAIVAKAHDSDTVQFQTSRRGVDALINGVRINFDVILQQTFNGVSITLKKNSTFYAIFAGGLTIEVAGNRELLTSLSMSVPESYIGKTAGLLGTFDGDLNNDLLSRGEVNPLDINASIQDVHQLFGATWILNSSMDSLFKYSGGDSFESLRDVDFTPNYATNFSDATLQAAANEICGEDRFCLYDIAATGRVDIGGSTVNASRSVDELVLLSILVVCEPPCENGVCLDGNICKCTMEYTGEHCSEPVYSSCEVCENGGTCEVHAGSLSCSCLPGYDGITCESPVCEPPCENGVCLDGNLCKCATEYTGERCSEQDASNVFILEVIVPVVCVPVAVMVVIFGVFIIVSWRVRGRPSKSSVGRSHNDEKNFKDVVKVTDV